MSALDLLTARCEHLLMNHHPLAVAGVIGAVPAVPIMAFMLIHGFGGGAILAVGGLVLLLIGTFVLIVLWVVETIRARR